MTQNNPQLQPSPHAERVVAFVRGLSLSPADVEHITQHVRECAAGYYPAPGRRKEDKDPGAHYRGPQVFGIPLDPYRILEAYPNITREAARHVVKKVLRMGKKGIGERQLIDELRCCIDRWEKMLNEEANAKADAVSEAGFEQLKDLIDAPPELDKLCPHCQTNCVNEAGLAAHLEDQHTAVEYARKWFWDAKGRVNMDIPEIRRDLLILAGYRRDHAEQQVGIHPRTDDVPSIYGHPLSDTKP